jgi:hypothetical protein
MPQPDTGHARQIYGMVLNICIILPILAISLVMLHVTCSENPHDVCQDLPKVIDATKGLRWILTLCIGAQAVNLRLKGGARANQ